MPLTDYGLLKNVSNVGRVKFLTRIKKIFEMEKNLSKVGFEPTPSYEDQNTLSLSVSKDTLSLAP